MGGATEARFVVCAIYKFVGLDDVGVLRDALLEVMRSGGVRGTLLLAGEGINGTVAGTRAGVDGVLGFLREDGRFDQMRVKESYCDKIPFGRAKVKVKKEIVTMGVEGVDPQQGVGAYVAPKDWNALISDPEVVTIDARNEYEVRIGTFAGAVDPGTRSFCEFPKYVEEHLDPRQDKKVAMFCTGGIRCEKATAYLKARGFEEVYHLEGGILDYLKQVPESESMWEGECFVFDQRVAVTHGVEVGKHELCFACRRPIGEEDKKQATYRAGVTCPWCYGETTAEQRAAFAEREKQEALAEVRGEKHIGRVLERKKTSC